MKKLTLLTAALLSVSMSQMASANDDKVWTVTQQIAQSTQRVAVLPFIGNNALSSAITAKLDTTELGATQNNLPQQTNNSNEILSNLNAWRNQGFGYVVIGQAHSIAGGKTAITYEVIDAINGKSLGGAQTHITDSNPSAINRTSAQLSDKIYQAITGQASDFGSKIAYVENTGTPSAPIATLKIIDSDGQNARTLYTVNGSILTPTFSPNGSQLAYSVQRQNGLPVIQIQSVNGGESRVVTPFWGHNLAPSFSPDGTSILFSGSHENNDPNIYRLNLSLNTLERLTNLNGAENSPNYLPNNQGFIFTADQGSRRQGLYRQNFSSQTATPLIANATNPRLSHDGSKIVYVAGSRIVIANTQGKTEQSFAASGTEISASLSPSGNQLVYALSQGKQSQLMIRNLHNNSTRAIATTGQVRDPIWSK